MNLFGAVWRSALGGGEAEGLDLGACSRLSWRRVMTRLVSGAMALIGLRVLA